VTGRLDSPCSVGGRRIHASEPISFLLEKPGSPRKATIFAKIMAVTGRYRVSQMYASRGPLLSDARPDGHGRVTRLRLAWQTVGQEDIDGNFLRSR